MAFEQQPTIVGIVIHSGSNWEKRRLYEPDGTPYKAYTNSVPVQHSSDGQHTLAIYTKCVEPLGVRTGLWAPYPECVYLNKRVPS